MGRTRKPKPAPQKRGSKPGTLHKTTRTVADNQRRIVVYPYRTPPIAYTVKPNGVIMHTNVTWNKAVSKTLIADGYTMQKRGNSIYVFDKFFEGKQ
jgi:hypothetical protein